MTVVSANTAKLDPKADRAAARAGLRQGQRVEELERMFDDAGADVIALQEHRLQTTGQRRGGLFQYENSAHKALSEMHFGSDEAVFKQFELTANAVNPRILSVCMPTVRILAKRQNKS